MEIKKLIDYLKIKKIEAIEKGYFLHGITERDGIVVVDLKLKTFSPAEACSGGECMDAKLDTLLETANNLILLGYVYDDDYESNPSTRWLSDFEPVEIFTGEFLKV